MTPTTQEIRELLKALQQHEKRSITLEEWLSGPNEAERIVIEALNERIERTTREDR